MKIKKEIIFIFFAVLLVGFISAENFAYNYITSNGGGTTTTITFSGNLTNFTDLSDTPNSYTGQGSKCLRVNAGETAVEFFACAGGGDFSFINFQSSFNLNASTYPFSTFNSTYNLWAYNQTGLFNYNQSSVYSYNHTSTIYTNPNQSWLSTYNSTYNLWAYNQSSTVISNMSWNQSYADLRYAGIIWNYNQTGLFNYNQTYSGSTYNSTYNLWAYNQTGLFNYNQTYSGSTYNATYNLWAYNQTSTSGGTYNATYHATTLQWNGNFSIFYGIVNNASYINNETFNYNQSNSIWNYNMTGIYNYNQSSVFSYNHTSTIYANPNQSWLSTYNATYNLWAYNMSPTSSMLNSIFKCAEGKILKRGGSDWECSDDNIGVGNSSWNQSYADTRYALNTTWNIQRLLKSNQLNLSSLIIENGANTLNVSGMFYVNSSNVGIGTVKPTDTLNVVGSMNVTLNSTMGAIKMGTMQIYFDGTKGVIKVT